jgi:hypothetical protein
VPPCEPRREGGLTQGISGTSLGLSLRGELLAQYGRQSELEFRQGAGSTCFVRLPFLIFHSSREEIEMHRYNSSDVLMETHAPLVILSLGVSLK